MLAVGIEPTSPLYESDANPLSYASMAMASSEGVEPSLSGLGGQSPPGGEDLVDFGNDAFDVAACDADVPEFPVGHHIQFPARLTALVPHFDEFRH